MTPNVVGTPALTFCGTMADRTGATAVLGTTVTVSSVPFGVWMSSVLVTHVLFSAPLPVWEVHAPPELASTGVMTNSGLPELSTIRSASQCLPVQSV